MTERPTREQADVAAAFLKSLSGPNRPMIVARPAESGAPPRGRGRSLRSSAGAVAAAAPAARILPLRTLEVAHDA